jgi:superfamily II DNA/RNA helicase
MIRAKKTRIGWNLLARIFGEQKIATIKGGPLVDKIEAAEQFWDENGAKFLISTSAGGEGINLQCGRILFNYDLPWNPMAVEQRIGRIHRYGQKEVSQVYNLVAKDTVEERIYALLTDKLQSIAQAIGKTDPQTGEPLEDFRTEILGFLGANPNYHQLFKQALVDRDYRRTERQIEKMMKQAQDARTALMSDGPANDCSFAPWVIRWVPWGCICCCPKWDHKTLRYRIADGQGTAFNPINDYMPQRCFSGTFCIGRSDRRRITKNQSKQTNSNYS